MRLVVIVMENAGHQVLQSENAVEGIRLAREAHPDLIFMDIQLPDMDGYICASSRDITEHNQSERALRESEARLSLALEDAIGAIAATLEQRDPYTAGHQRRVAELATTIAKEMELAPELIEGIHFGGLIHDIGKFRCLRKSCASRDASPTSNSALSRPMPRPAMKSSRLLPFRGQ